MVPAKTELRRLAQTWICLRSHQKFDEAYFRDEIHDESWKWIPNMHKINRHRRILSHMIIIVADGWLALLRLCIRQREVRNDRLQECGNIWLHVVCDVELVVAAPASVHHVVARASRRFLDDEHYMCWHGYNSGIRTESNSDSSCTRVTPKKVKYIHTNMHEDPFFSTGMKSSIRCCSMPYSLCLEISWEIIGKSQEISIARLEEIFIGGWGTGMEQKRFSQLH